MEYKLKRLIFKTKFNILLLFIFSTLLLGCSNFSENQKALLDKKWYLNKNVYLEFTSDLEYIIHSKDSVINYTFEFQKDNVLKIINSKKGDFSSVYFYVKDSILFFVPYESSKRKGDTQDTTFYHLNPKYEFWQTRQLYYYGKVINDNGKPKPFIYFQF